MLKNLLQNELNLLPKLSEVTGKIKIFSDPSLSVSLSTPSEPGVITAAASGTTALATLDTKEEVPKKLKIVDRKELKKEPWDIRDALLRRKSLRAENQCFYWFYKSLPGGGELERFRRERDCDEYEYDL